MKKMMFLMLTLFFLSSASMNAQVRIGGTADPNPNALLDVNKDTITVTGNNTGGLALPRVALTSTTTAAPVGTRFVKGMLVYNTATAGTAPNNVTPGAYYSDGAKWIRVSGSDAPVSGWQLGGNTVANGDFIGATNNHALVFQIQGDTVGYVNKSSVAAWGDKALQKSTGANNTAVGGSALAVNTTGTNNTAVGYNALAKNETSTTNVAVGASALSVHLSGNGNVAVGYQSLLRDTTGIYNTAVGNASQYANTDGQSNTAVGYGSLYSNKASDNTAVGFRSLYANTTGQFNTAVGDSASRNNTTGSRNTTLGHRAGANITTGSNNIAIGDSTLMKSATTSNRLNIGNWIYGNDGRIRIGYLDPHASAILDLNATNDVTPAVNLGGVALPRVSLESNKSQLNGAYPIQGEVVYNTNPLMTNGPGTGLYVWTGASTTAGQWRNIPLFQMITTFTISPTRVNLPLEREVTMTTKITPKNATNPELAWKSSDPAVATIDEDGLIEGLTVGTTTITATTTDSSRLSRTATVRVFEEIYDTVTIAGTVYDTYTFPDGLGTWTLQQVGGRKITKAAALTTCPSPWRLPTKDEVTAMRTFNNQIQISDRPWTTETTSVGYYTSPTSSYNNSSNYMWYADPGETAGTALWNIRRRDQVVSVSSMTQTAYAARVRCVKF